MAGSHHFYAAVIAVLIGLNKCCVNALCRAHIISTEKLVDSFVLQQGCVNALCRAHIISTLPLQNLSIYAAFRACFCTYFSELSDYWVQ